jgi:hypothetical protein
MAFSGFADVTENVCSLGVRAWKAAAFYATGSENERCFRIVGEFCADVFDSPPPFASEKIKPKAVLGRIG